MSIFLDFIDTLSEYVAENDIKNRASNLIDLSIPASLGRPWWGFETAKSRVIFINQENPTPVFHVPACMTGEAST
jgi:hypothetical protein